MEIEKFMTRELQKGFASKTPPKMTVENGFQIKYVNFRQPDGPSEGSLYLDQWTKGRLGLGMELGFVLNGEKADSMGRAYAGGTLPGEELQKLGITRDMVLDKIKEVITKYGEKTRLFEDFHPKPDGPWKYSYDIIARYPAFELTIAEETLGYDEKLVFIHPFFITGIK